MEANQKIEIKTLLHEGIYKSEGGGEVRTQKTYKLTDRALIIAMRDVVKIRNRMIRAYGNVGHCATWIEVAGVEMDDADILNFDYYTNPENFRDFYEIGPIKKGQWCRDYIASVLDGSLIEGRKRAEAAWQEEKENL